MEIEKILDELYERRDCIDVAIEALEWSERRARGKGGQRPVWLPIRKQRWKESAPEEQADGAQRR